MRTDDVIEDTMSSTNYITVITIDEIKDNMQIFTTLWRNKRSSLIVPVLLSLLRWKRKCFAAMLICSPNYYYGIS
jgi:hypothetical protein